MRILAGDKKGHALCAPRGLQTRPTLGRVRESLFSILGAHVIDSHVVDLFAGAGSLGLEALSRGAAHCTFVERERAALEALRANIEKLDYASSSTVVPDSAERWIARPHAGVPCDLALLDAPYEQQVSTRTLNLIAAHLPLSANAIVVAQCSTRESVPDETGTLHRYRTEKYGDTALHFFEISEGEAR